MESKMNLEESRMRSKRGQRLASRMNGRILFLSLFCALQCQSSALHVFHATNQPIQTRMTRMNLYIRMPSAPPRRSESESHCLRMTASEQEILTTGEEKDESGNDDRKHDASQEKNESVTVDNKHDVLSSTKSLSSETEQSDGQTKDAMKQGNKRGLPPEYQVCRVVALPDSKLPTTKSELPPAIVQPPFLLDKLDAIYHAMSHEETRQLRYLERSDSMEPLYEEKEEKNLVSVLRNSLEDAGFELLTRRDVDLCEALNAGYLLRLSIAPDVSGFDPTIAKHFYPEHFDKEGNPDEDLLFEGRVLLYRRGYSSEVTKGRLLLPKIDYLQASLVQRSARQVTQRVARIEKQLLSTITAISRHVKIVTTNQLAKLANNVPIPKVAYFLRSKWGWKEVDQETLDHDKEDMANIGFFKFSRYGGDRNSRFMGSPSINDALDPFLSCEIVDIDDIVNGESIGEVNGQLNASDVTCQYDSDHSDQFSSSLEDQSVLLERVSINNVVDLSTREGRRTVVKRFFTRSKLVEPTFKEVVAIWRPLPEKPKPKLLPPKFVYSVAEIFEVEDKLPEFEEPEPDPLPPPLEIRAYDDVPMANAPAVLPKTKLLFRPADAFVFDLVTILSFLVVIGSQRFDSSRLDVLAIVSGTLWIIRTIIRYSNKLARYDLLVKKFLTSKISHRNSGALKYITREAGNQRATRAALVYLWLTERMKTTGGTVTRSVLIEEGSLGVNELILHADESKRCVRVDMDAALNDLTDLDMVEFSADGDTLTFLRDDGTVIETLLSTWTRIFEGELSLNRLVGRRRREPQTVSPTE